MEQDFPSISVIIPTYKPNDLIADAIRSCLEQDYPEGKIEIIVSVNGADTQWAEQLTEAYKAYPQIRVVHTPVAGAGAGRNYGKKFIRTEFATYLDDDDYFTKGYLKELASYVAEDVTMVCGWQLDEEPDGTRRENPYFKDILQKYGGSAYAQPWFAAPYLGGPCMKLYRTSQLQNVWGDFDESLTHTEDIVFWVENVYKPMGKTAVVTAGSGEAYIRRLREDSLSRPSREKAFAFYVMDTIALIERFTKAMLQEARSEAYRDFVRGKIDSANNRLYQYFKECSFEEKCAVAEAVKKSDCIFLNKSKVSVTPAIAFCHELMQLADAAGVAAAKRLGQISDYGEELLNWAVVRGTGRLDKEGEELFAKYRYTEKITIPGSEQLDENSQREWAEKAFAAVKDKEADYIYSGGKFACSHAAALAYKRAHPETVWIAELAGFADGSLKKNSFWRELEAAVCKEADRLLFGDETQKAYLQERTSSQIADKALILPHLPMDAVYEKISSTKYKVDPNAINIACFGTPIEKRQVLDLLKLLKNSKVQLHIFTTLALGRAKILDKFFRRIHICPPVSCVEEHSAARKMDYLYLSDPVGAKSGWPELPESLADYLSVETPVIAKVYPNTPMSKLEHERLIKVETIDRAFAVKLSKQQSRTTP